MSASTRDPIDMPLAIMFAFGPLIAGVIRLVSTRSDLRLLEMAVAAIASSVAAAWLIPSARDGRMTPASLGVATFALATIVTAITGYLLGARAIVGVIMIALVMGAFVGASNYFRARTRLPARRVS